ncbi:MAG: DUF494 family protein [bacterium]
MNERVVEILIYIMSEIRRDRNASGRLDVLSENLIQQGYTETEISSAFTWLLNRLQTDSEELFEHQDPSLEYSFRHLHEIERSVISVEAHGYIIQLKELGIIDELGVEQVLERAMMMGASEVTVVDIKSIVASMLFNPESLMDNNYFLFDDNPTIQ